jgi:glycosyltransferase involved in cell wall biosynthesis
VNFTCLLPVHEGDDAEHLRQALDSIAGNSVRPDHVFICEDGPLLESQAEAVEAFARGWPTTRLRNLGPRGLHHNLNHALGQVRTDWFCRADADDLNDPRRFERQAQFLGEHPRIDVLGADMLEFWPDGRSRRKSMPRDHHELVRWAYFRNPINHPTVFARTAAVVGCGGYPPIAKREDYGLWLKMMAAGFVFHNFPEALVKFRLGPSYYRRRAGLDGLAAEYALFRLKMAGGLVPPAAAAASFIGRTLALGVSPALAAAIYRRLRPRAVPRGP